MTAYKERRHSRLLKRSSRFRFAQLILAACLLSPGMVFPSTPAPVAADPLSDALQEQQRISKLIADQKAQLAKLNKQQAALNGQIASTKKDLANVSVSIEDSQTQIDALAVQLDGVRVEYDKAVVVEESIRAELDRVRAERDAKELELKQRQAALAERLRQAYYSDGTPMLERLLHAHSITEALSDVSYLSSMAESDREMAEQIQKDTRALAKLQRVVMATDLAALETRVQVAFQKHQMDDAAAQLAQAKADLETLKNKLEGQLAAQAAAQAKLVKDKNALAAAIRSNGQALDSLANQIDALLGQSGHPVGQIPSEYNGTLKWPMGGRITQNFGCTGIASEPRVGSCRHFHQGIDIAAPCGTPVRAAADGVIVFVGYNPYDAPPRAWLVIVAHSSTMVTWYAHMAGHAPAGIYVGAPVTQGQLVGLEDTTGHSTGCHLHWAVRVNGTFVNPRLFL